MMETGNRTVSSDFLRVLLALKNNVMRDNNVAEIVIVREVLETVIKCELLSDQTKRIECVPLKNLSVTSGDLALVIFTNSDFRQNYVRFKNNQPLQISKSIMHSLNYGVIVGIL